MPRSATNNPASDSTAEQTSAKQKLAIATAELKSHATSINASMRNCANSLQRADDHRLNAAIKLSEAVAKLKESNVRPSTWGKANLAISWETARKLIPIGDAERAQEGAGAALLAKMREDNRIANAEMRARKASESDSDSDGNDESTVDPEVKQANRVKVLLNLFNAMNEAEQRAVVADLAKMCGMTSRMKAARQRS